MIEVTAHVLNELYSRRLSEFPRPFLMFRGDLAVPFDKWLKMSGNAWRDKRALLPHCLGTKGLETQRLTVEGASSFDRVIKVSEVHFNTKKWWQNGKQSEIFVMSKTDGARLGHYLRIK